MGCVTVGIMMFQRSSHMPTTTSAEAMTVDVTGLALSHWLTLSRRPKTLRMSKVHKTVDTTALSLIARTGALIKLGATSKAVRTTTAMAEPLTKRGWKIKARCSSVCFLSMDGTTRI